jgi:hypothetical protein
VPERHASLAHNVQESYVTVENDMKILPKPHIYESTIKPPITIILPTRCIQIVSTTRGVAVRWAKRGVGFEKSRGGGRIKSRKGRALKAFQRQFRSSK